MPAYKPRYTSEQVRSMHLDALGEFMLHAQRTLCDPHARDRTRAAAIKGLAQMTLALQRTSSDQGTTGSLASYTPAQIRAAVDDLVREHASPELTGLLAQGTDAILGEQEEDDV